jgi:uncharacterized protein YraI
MLKKLAIALLIGTLSGFGTLVEAQAVANGDVNLRSGPGTGYARVSTIAKGTQVYLHGCLSSGWCRVSMPNATGWAFGRYLDQYRPAHWSMNGAYALSLDGTVLHPNPSPFVVMRPRAVQRFVLLPVAPQQLAYGGVVRWGW